MDKQGDLSGKICMVTGANSGVGLYTAVGLARSGARLLLVCRNEEKGGQAAEFVRKETGNGDIDIHSCEFSSLESVRALSESLHRKHDRLDVLVNNAGLMTGLVNRKRSLSGDGYELTFAVNHLAPFLLTNLLLDLLQAGAPARIVNVSSQSHHSGRIDFDDLFLERGFKGYAAYANSKLANILFTRELARRFAKEGVLAVSLHPGVVATNIIRKGNWLARLLMGFSLSPEEGAETSIYLASTADELQNGGYYDKCRPKTPSEFAKDDEAARRLWEESERLTGLA